MDADTINNVLDNTSGFDFLSGFPQSQNSGFGHQQFDLCLQRSLPDTGNMLNNKPVFWPQPPFQQTMPHAASGKNNLGSIEGLAFPAMPHLHQAQYPLPLTHAESADPLNAAHVEYPGGNSPYLIPGKHHSDMLSGNWYGSALQHNIDIRPSYVNSPEVLELNGDGKAQPSVPQNTITPTSKG